jgi:hypothetical protein
MVAPLDLTFAAASDVSVLGGSGNDTFAFAATLTNADTVDGAGGTTDLLSATVTGLTATIGALKISNVETLNLTEAGTTTIDATNITGSSSINFAGASTTLTVTNLAAGQAIGLGFVGTATGHSAGTVTSSLKDATGTADSLTINLQNTGAQAATLVTTGIETVTLAVNAEVNNTQTLNTTSLAAATLKVTGSTNGNNDVVALGTLSTTTTTLDASGFTGAVTATASATGTAIKMSGTNAANNIAGGAGNDTVTYKTFGAVAESVVGGGGTGDALVITSLTGNLDATNIATFESFNITLGANQTTGTATGLITADVLTQTWSGTYSLTSSQALHTNLTSFNASGVSGVVALTNTTVDIIDNTVTVTGGSGTSDVLNTLYNTAATYAPVISGFETVQFIADANDTSGETNAFNLAGLTGATNVTFATGTGVANTVNVTNYNGTATLQLGITANGGVDTIFQGSTTSAFGVTLANSAGATDALNLKLVDTDNAAGTVTITATGVEIINIDAGASTSAEDHKISLSGVTSTSSAAQTINITNGMTNVTAGTLLTITNTNDSVSTISASTFVGDLVISDRGLNATTITTGTGADTIAMKNTADVIDAGTQTTGLTASNGDTLSLSATTLAGQLAVVDLSSTTDQVTTFKGGASTVAQKGFENVNASAYTGGAGVDVTGSSSANIIVGTSAGDVINAGGGSDTVTGGAGADNITLTESTSAADIVRIDPRLTSASGEVLTGRTVAGADIITGFVSGTDKIDIGGITLRDNTNTAAAVVTALGTTDDLGGTTAGFFQAITLANSGDLTTNAATARVIEITTAISGNFTLQSGIDAALASTKLTGGVGGFGVTASGANAGNNMLVIVYDDQTTANAALFTYTVNGTGTGTDPVAADFQLVGVLTGVGTGALQAGDFI